MPHQGTAYIFIVPRDEILQRNHRVLEFIKNRLAQVENYTAGFLIFLVLVATALALRFSRTVTRPLEALSQVVQKLGQGDFDARVSIKSKDEFGDMGQVVNRVGPQLKENYRMRRSLEVAMEVQQNLLPDTPPALPGLDIYGMTLFCDETGGDYFDYLCMDEEDKTKLCLVVGDVVGHGIPAALLMATARGFLRLRATMPGTLGDIITDVNREFVKDAENSTQFMTLLLARIDRGENRMDWVRAGHDPAIVYYSDSGSFSSLDDGKGMALGISKDTVYTAYNFSPDYSGEDGLGHYGNGTLDLALPYEFTLGGEIGYQYVEGDDTTGSNMGMNGDDGYDYWHWRVSFTKDIPKWFTLDLSYHNTDSDAQNFFGDIADPRLVFTISRTF